MLSSIEASVSLLTKQIANNELAIAIALNKLKDERDWIHRHLISTGAIFNLARWCPNAITEMLAHRILDFAVPISSNCGSELCPKHLQNIANRLEDLEFLIEDRGNLQHTYRHQSSIAALIN